MCVIVMYLRATRVTRGLQITVIYLYTRTCNTESIPPTRYFRGGKAGKSGGEADFVFVCVCVCVMHLPTHNHYFTTSVHHGEKKGGTTDT